MILANNSKGGYLRGRLSIIAGLALFVALLAPSQTFAQISTVSCFSVSDHDFEGAGADTDNLFSYNLPDIAGSGSDLGDIGTNEVEAIEYVTHRDKLYFGDGTEIWVSNGTDGYEDLTSCGSIPGVTDIDGMAYDANLDVFYISDRNGTAAPGGGGAGGAGAPDDELRTIRISDDTCTITAVAGPFNIPTTAATPAPGLADVDDLAVDPNTGTLYGIANNSNGSDSFLVTINPSDGSVLSTVAMDLGFDGGAAGNVDEDAEGLTFTPDGDLLVSLGESAGQIANDEGPNSNEVYVLNPVTGVGTRIGDISADITSTRTDMESITCGQPELKLGDTVWNDLDNSGTLNGAEVGIDGVDIILRKDTSGDGTPDTVIGNPQTTATVAGQAGMYMFGNLMPGTYDICIAATEFNTGATLDGFVSSTGNGADAPDPDNNLDSDDNGAPAAGGQVCSDPVTLLIGDEPLDNPDATGPLSYNPTVDLGVFQPVSLGDLVFCDENGNSVFDAGDTVVNDVTVELYLDSNNNGTPEAGEFVSDTETAGGGLYSFTGLNPGDYIVVIPAEELAAGGDLEGKASSPGNPDPDNNTDNDDNGAPGAGGDIVTLPITLVGGDENGDGDSDPNNNPSVDLGFVSDLSLGDLVFCDENGNSVFDAGDTGVNDVTVQLYLDSNGNGTPEAGEFVTDTETAGGGLYSFGGLAPGNYIVQIPASEFAVGGDLEGKGSSPGNPDPDNNTDNDDNGGDVGPTGSFTAPITLSVGGENNDGDADADNNPSVDLGYVPGLSLGDLVFCDENGNSVFDAGDTVVNDVTVQLYLDGNNNGTPEAGEFVTDTVTAGGGLYSFGGLAAGNYIVVIPASELAAGGDLEGKASSPGNPDPDNNTDNDDNGAPNGAGDIVTQPITLTAGGEENDGDADPDNNPSVDLGFVPNLSLGDVVFCDSDGSGTFTAGEGADDVTVNLYLDGNGDGVAQAGEFAGTTTTAGGGLYSFTGLAPGDYIVVIPATEFAAGGDLAGKDSLDGQPDPDNNVDGDDNSGPVDENAAVPGSATLPITLTTGGEENDGDADPDNNPSLDLGFELPLALGSVVWCELSNSDQVFGGAGTDTPIGGLNLDLYRDTNFSGVADAGDELVKSTTTDAVTGEYLFSDLAPGIYFVVVPAGQAALEQKSNIVGSSQPNDNTNNDSNALSGGPNGPSEYSTGPITMSVGGEPDNDGDLDTNTNLAIDLGFFDPSLPVEMTSFDLEIVDMNAEMTWTTASELDNVGFAVEMSENGAEYEEKGFVAGNGTIDTESVYNFTAENLSPGTYNFRLKQVDLSGVTTYSEVLAAVVDLPGDYLLENAYPNPFNPSTKIRFTVKERQEVRMALYDATGREIKTLFEGTPEAGSAQEITIEASNLPSGTYLIRLAGVDFSATQTITLIK